MSTLVFAIADQSDCMIKGFCSILARSCLTVEDFGWIVLSELQWTRIDGNSDRSSRNCRLQLSSILLLDSVVREHLDFCLLYTVSLALGIRSLFREAIDCGLFVVNLPHRIVFLVILEARVDVGTIAFRGFSILNTTVDKLLLAQIGQDPASDLVCTLKRIVGHESPRCTACMLVLYGRNSLFLPPVDTRRQILRIKRLGEPIRYHTFLQGAFRRVLKAKHAHLRCIFHILILGVNHLETGWHFEIEQRGVLLVRPHTEPIVPHGERSLSFGIERIVLLNEGVRLGVVVSSLFKLLLLLKGHTIVCHIVQEVCVTLGLIGENVACGEGQSSYKLLHHSLNKI